MAIKFTIDNKHIVCFPTKIASGIAGHILNIELTEDTDNGVVVTAGKYTGFDGYVAAAAPTTYEAVITDQAANGNWYVQVTKADTSDVSKMPVLIYEVPVIAETYDVRFTDLHNFYNEKGKTVRGYVLAPFDVYEVSPEAFTGTPEAGKKVTITGQKHVVS